MWKDSLCIMKLLFMSLILGYAVALPSPENPAPHPNCIRMTREMDQQIDLIVEKLGSFLYNLTIEHEQFDIRLIKLSIEQHTEDEVEEKETVLQLSVNDCQLSAAELEEIDHHREKAKQHEKEREAIEAEKLRKEQKGEENDAIDDANEQNTDIPKDKQDKPENDQNSDDHEQTKNRKEIQTNEAYLPDPVQKEVENSNNDEAIEENNDKSDVHDETDDNLKKEHKNQDTRDKLEDEDPNEAENLNNNDEQGKPSKNFTVMYLDLDDNGQKLLEVMGKKKKGPRIVYVQERNSGQTEYWFLKRR